MTVELRPPRREDAPAIAGALTKFARVAGTEEETPAEVESWFELPSLDLEQDARVAVVDGEIVGYADLNDSSREGKFLRADVRGDPDHPLAQSALLDFVEERARKLASPGGLIKAWAPEGAAAWCELLEGRGFEIHHYSLRLTAPLDDEPPPPAWPDGISLRTFQDADTRRVYELQQETFSDQRDFTRDTFEDWKHWSFQEPFDPNLWFLAVGDDDVAGIALCRPERDGDATFGWVSVLGVRKPWRRNGLGLALLHHSFRELRKRGKTRVGLGVDADNPTGAVRLYERAGMETERRYIWYEKVAR
jgi:mycothiol synthase